MSANVKVTRAEEAKNKVEDLAFLSSQDFEEVQRRIDRAILSGQRKTSIRYERNDKRFWPMKSYLESLGYQTIARATAYGNNLIWSW